MESKPHSMWETDADLVRAAIRYAGHHTTCASVMLGEECDCGYGRANAALARIEEQLEASEKYAAEGWAWLSDALRALGAETVFQIGERKVQFEALDQAYRQACMNLATIRPDLSRDDFSLGEQAELYYDALLAGWGGIEGYDPGRRSGSAEAAGQGIGSPRANAPAATNDRSDRKVWGPERMRHDPA